MKKILIFSTAYYPFVAGAEVAIKEITDRLSPEFEFDLITAKMDKSLPNVEKIGVVTVYRIGKGRPTMDKIFLPFRGAILAHKLQRQEQYFCFWGVMVTFGTGAGYVYNIFRMAVGQRKIPMVLTLQEGDSESHLKYRWGGLIALSWRLALMQTDILTGLSNFLLNRAKKNGYKGEEVLVPNGVDVENFSKVFDETQKKEISLKLNKKDGDIFLVTISRLVKKNAVDDIISSLVYLPENISLIVLGVGDEGSNLQKQAQNLGVENRVKFLGFVSHTDIPKYLSVCDIFIRPSRSEGFGNSFIEAMASRLPVIATPVGGIPDFIDDKETGIFCSPDNPHSIADTVNTLMNDKILRDKITSNAYERVVSRYSWDKIGQKMKNLVFDRLAK